jgi:ABC-type microcin C transport system permease subunit YejB
MRQLLRRIVFYVVALWASVTINFIIPRLAPGNPAEAPLPGSRANLARLPYMRWKSSLALPTKAAGRSTGNTSATCCTATWDSPSPITPPPSLR